MASRVWLFILGPHRAFLLGLTSRKIHFRITSYNTVPMITNGILKTCCKDHWSKSIWLWESKCSWQFVVGWLQFLGFVNGCPGFETFASNLTVTHSFLRLLKVLSSKPCHLSHCSNSATLTLKEQFPQLTFSPQFTTITILELLFCS